MGNRIERYIPAGRAPYYLARFYGVGFILFALPFTRDFFVSVTAVTLLLAFGLVFLYHKGWDVKTVCLFLFIILAGFFLEMAGTNTGQVFGVYAYGRGLGVQVRGTPLIIGLNWLFLTYASHSIATRLVRRDIYRVVAGAFLMVGYDMLLEWVAPCMEMWRFATAVPPLRNYVVWLVTALLFHTAFRVLRIRTDNPPARWLFLIQGCFFVLIGIYCEIFIR